MLPCKKIYGVMFLMLFIGISSVTGDADNGTSYPEYRTTFKEIPSPDWFFPVRVFLSLFYSTTTAYEIWNSVHVDNVTNITKVDYETIVTPMIGMITLAAIGILFALITIVGGIILCCCRLCDNCGGNYKQSLKSSENSYCRYVLTSILVFALLVSLVALIFMYFSLPVKKNIISEYTGSLDDNILDLQVYINFSRQEIDVLIKKDIIDTLEELSLKLEHFGSDIGDRIFDGSNQMMVDVLKQLSTTADGVNQLHGLLTDINNETTNVDNQVTNLNEQINAIGVSLDDFVSSCSNETMCPGTCHLACENITAMHSSSNFNITTLNLDLEEEINKLNDVIGRNLTNSIETYNSTFYNISSLVDKAAKPSMSKISAKLNDTNDFVSNSMANMDTFFNQLSDSISKVHDKFHIVEDNVGIADNILFGVSLGISIFLSLIWILFTCGLFGGTIVFDHNVSPTKRSGVSDFFGSLLLIAVGLTFCVSGILWLLTVVLSIPGSGLYFVVCQTLFDDKFAILDSLTRRNILPIPSEYSFNISTMLNSCQSNYSAFYSFGLIESVAINDTLYVDMNNVTNVWNASDTSNWNLGLDNSDINGTLSNFSSAMDFSFDSYLNNVSDVLSVQLQNITNCFSEIQLQLDVINVTDLEKQASQLKLYINNFKKSASFFTTSIDKLNSTIQTWTTMTDDMKEGVSNCSTLLPEMSTVITSSAVNAVTDYSLDFVDNLYNVINDLVFKLYNDVGNCWPIWLIFQSLRVTSCRNVLDSLNSFWFNMGVVLFFFLVAVIPALKLMKYFRIMNNLSSSTLQRSPPIPRRPEKINQTTNRYFDDMDTISTVDQNVTQEKNNRIQCIINGFDQKQFLNVMPQPPDLIKGNAFRGAPEPNIMEPAIRISPEELEIYKRIPRISNRTPPSSVCYDYLIPYENKEVKPRFYSKVSPIPPPRAKPFSIPSIPYEKDRRYQD